MQKEVRDWSSEILMLVKEFEVKAADSPRRRPPQSAASPLLHCLWKIMQVSMKTTSMVKPK